MHREFLMQIWCTVCRKKFMAFTSFYWLSIECGPWHTPHPCSIHNFTKKLLFVTISTSKLIFTRKTIFADTSKQKRIISKAVVDMHLRSYEKNASQWSLDRLIPVTRVSNVKALRVAGQICIWPQCTAAVSLALVNTCNNCNSLAWTILNE